MKQFSYSKLKVFERCPLNYKFQYLTSLKPEGEETAEAFVGSRVHETLELLYRDLMKTKLNSLDDLLQFYDRIWRVEWKDDIVMKKGYNQKHYYDYGVKCIKNYYQKHKPFTQEETIAVEKKVSLYWDEYEIIGYIDRLARLAPGIYAVHDYKTGERMDQEYADQDTQLALYAIWVKQEFKEAREVKLIWHYVKVGEDVVSVRTDEELKQLKEDILAQIKEINRAEAEDDFPAQETKCEWCGYWQYCPKKKHLYKVEKLPENEYLKEDGVQLARKYIELSDKRLEINKRARTEIELINGEMEKVKEAIIKYAKEHQTEVLDGGDRVVVVNKKESYDIPTKTADKERYDKLEEILKKTKYWPAVSSVNGSKLASLLQSGAIDNKLAAKLQELITKREDIGLSVRKK